MRVLIDTTFAVRAPHSGTAVYLDRLIAALRATGAVEVQTAVNPHRTPAAGGLRSSLRNAAVDAWWIQRELPRLARAAGVSVVHHPLPAASGPPTPRAFGEVVTVHDLAFAQLPAAFARGYRTWASRAHRAAARRAGAVVAVSGVTAAEIEARWGIDPVRIVVAPHGPGQIDGPVARTAVPRHFLYVGDAEPRKDLPTLLAGYAAYRSAAPGAALPLVLAGPGSLAQVGRAARPGVHVETDVTPARLAELHAAAAALVQPSRLEGFGLTVLEAMRAGTPVIGAAVPGTVEVGGDAIELVPPGDPAGVAAAMSQAASDAPWRVDRAQRGHARAAAYSWERSARAHLAAYSLAGTRGQVTSPRDSLP